MRFSGWEHGPLRAVAGLALLVGSACGSDGETPPPADAADPSPVITASGTPLEWIPHTFLARPQDQDWVERIPASRVGGSFLLTLEPQVRSPAEGPWTLTLAGDGNPAIARIPGLYVDRATGRLTFVVRTGAIAPGDYLIVLELAEGGMATGPNPQVFPFRVE